MKNSIKGLLSIIVPVYNVEQYVDICIESICAQTYKTLQIILVNDGSQDLSRERCLEWARKDDRIVLVDKDHGGISDARNVGLSYAKGEWITFVDSDDYIEPEMYYEMISTGYKNESQICVCGANVWNNKKIRWVSSMYAQGTSTGIEGLVLLFDNTISVTVWNKIYRRELFENILFPVGKIYEDEFVMPQLFLKSDRISYVNRAFYNYLERSGSTLRSAFSEKSFNRLDAIKYQVDNFSDISEYINKVLRKKYYCAARDIYCQAIAENNEGLESVAYQLMKTTVPGYWKYATFSDRVRMLPILGGRFASRQYFIKRCKNN